jgi:hypothetical protein
LWPQARIAENVSIHPRQDCFTAYGMMAVN